jgi:hypothetical protein
MTLMAPEVQRQLPRVVTTIWVDGSVLALIL